MKNFKKKKNGKMYCLIIFQKAINSARPGLQTDVNKHLFWFILGSMLEVCAYFTVCWLDNCHWLFKNGCGLSNGRYQRGIISYASVVVKLSASLSLTFPQEQRVYFASSVVESAEIHSISKKAGELGLASEAFSWGTKQSRIIEKFRLNYKSERYLYNENWGFYLKLTNKWL